jgi:hypothetical protein
MQRPSRHHLCFFLILGIALCFFHETAQALNPVVSSWENNLSNEISTYSSGNYLHELVVADGVVHTMWVAKSSDSSSLSVYYRRSPDGGLTWGPVTTVATFANSAAYDARWAAKRLAVENGNVYIFHSTQWSSGGSWGGLLSVSVSNDNGVSFAAPKTLYTGDAAIKVYGRVASADSGRVSISVHRQVNWNTDCSFLLLSSTDGGQNWLTTTAFSHTGGQASYDIDDYLRVGNNVFLLYHYWYFYYGEQYGYVRLLVSNDGGATFADQLLSIPNKDGTHLIGFLQDENYVPKIAFDGTNVAVALNCQDDEDNTSTVYLRTSQDRGQTFADAVPVSRLDGAKLSPQPGQENVALVNGHVYVTFCDTGSKIYFQPATPSGSLVGGLSTLTTAAQGSSTGWWPVLALSPTDTAGASPLVQWNGSDLVTVANDGQSPRFPAMVGTNLYRTDVRPRLQVDASGVGHYLSQKAYYSASLCGGTCYYDVFYHRLPQASAQSANNRSMQVQNDASPPPFEIGTAGLAQVASQAINALTTKLSVEAWIAPTAGGAKADANRQPFLFKLANYGITTDYMHPFSLGLRPDGELRKAYAHLRNDDTGLDAWLWPTGEDAVVANNAWTHLAFTFDLSAAGDNFKLYRNGRLIAATRVTSAFNPQPGTLIAGRFGNMRLDEIRIWSTARSAQEIQSTMNRALRGNEPGLAAYYPFNNSTGDASPNGNRALLMFQETYADGAPLLPPGAAASLNFLLLQ